MSPVNTGAFGSKILAKYCGDTINNQFYDESHPMLLTERQMAFITTQLMIAFMISTFITIIFQITLQIYIRSIRSCCLKCKKCISPNQSAQSSDPNNISLTIKNTAGKPLKGWSNDDIISWIEAADISNETKSAFIEEMRSNNYDGADVVSFKDSTEFMESFASISNNTELCDTLFTELSNLRAHYGLDTESPRVPSQDNNASSSFGCVTKALMVICVVWSYVLSFIVLIHFFHQLHLYFQFVRNTVEFPQTDAETREECEVEGLGRIACPHLFEVFEQYEKDDADEYFINEPYTQQQAENICFWVYNALVIANPTLFEYAWFATFTMVDSMLYLLIMFMTGCFVITSCDLWTMLGCWCACCCTTCDCVCCPVPRCCCQIAWGNKCCQEGCCCYTLYGCFGFVAWLFQWALTFVMTSLVLAILIIPLCVISSTLSVITFVIILLATLPLCLCNPKLFCPLVFETYIGNDNVVDLQVSREGNVAYLYLQFCCRVFIPIPLPYSNEQRNNSEYCREKFILDPIELRAYGHAVIFLKGIFMILIIAGVQTLISTFLIYFVIDGKVFISWHYFGPFFDGVKDALVLIADMTPRTVQDLDELKYVVMESLSLDLFIDFNTKQPDGFKYALLLHRTVLHSLIGIIYVIMNL
eukprot:271340_1